MLRVRRAAAWTAILAMVLNALWPLLAVAKPGAPDPFGAEVCTAQRLVVVVVDSGLQLPGRHGPAKRLLPHCAFCSLGAGHATLHAPDQAAVPAALPPDEKPSGRRFSFLPRFLSTSLRSRAPPA